MAIDMSALRHVMVSEWRLHDAGPSGCPSPKERWRRLLERVVPAHAPALRFTGLIEAWACPCDDGRMWIVSLHASASSLQEAASIWRVADEDLRGGIDRARMTRQFSGLIADILPLAQTSLLRAFESSAVGLQSERWLQLTRWRVRPTLDNDGDQFRELTSKLGPLLLPGLETQCPVLAWAMDSGEDTFALATMFMSQAALEAAWQEMRREGPLRSAIEERLVLTEFVSGELIDLFALAGRAHALGISLPTAS